MFLGIVSVQNHVVVRSAANLIKLMVWRDYNTVKYVLSVLKHSEDKAFKNCINLTIGSTASAYW